MCLDDVIIFSRSIGEHFTDVRAVQRLLQQADVTLKLFFQASDDYVGHMVLPDTLQVAAATTTAIKLPRTHIELRSFLVLRKIYHGFVPGLAKIASPRTEVLTREKPSESDFLSDDQFEAYQKLKDILVNAPILVLPKANKPYILDTDASATQVSCGVLQEQHSPKDYRSIGY